MNKLSEEQVQKLIDFVQARPALYHKEHPNYKKLEQKEKFWKEIASNLCADVKDCKAAWRCLKDQFVRRLRQMKGKTGQSANVLTTKYKNFERLLFLKDCLEQRNNLDDEMDETLDCEAVYGDFEFSEVTAIRTVPVTDISPNSTSSRYVFPRSSASTSRKRQISELQDFDCAASSSQTTTLPELSPTEDNFAADNSFSTSSSSTFSKQKKTDKINEEFSYFLKKLSSSIETEEPDNVCMFFESMAKSAKAFKFTSVEMTKLMFGTTELLHKILANREQQ